MCATGRRTRTEKALVELTPEELRELEEAARLLGTEVSEMLREGGIYEARARTAVYNWGGPQSAQAGTAAADSSPICPSGCVRG